MMRHVAMPVVMGTAMGLMMLWMLHLQLTGGQSRSFSALFLFVGAHVAILSLALTLPFFASERLRRLAGRLHRPSLQHVGLMLAGAGVAAGVTHLVIHGGAL
ncbi:MAG: hypothetical protein ABJ263_16290 [Tateyamaria sp.]|uniref:hypothetical protein n=1 Tax=Tateyamaria sp. TaxID=1929288 RepID=UPI003287A301